MIGCYPSYAIVDGGYIQIPCVAEQVPRGIATKERICLSEEK